MRFFSKNFSQSNTDEGTDNAVDTDTSRSDVPSDISRSKEIALVQKDIDTLKALTSALREMKKDDQERFVRLQEQIGEMRNALFTKDQEMKDLNIRVAKAIDLVETAQVEKVLVEKKKEDAKIQMLEAKIESNKAVMESILSNLKDIRTKIDMFKGVEQVIALNNEVKNDLSTIQYVKGEVERHADKMENIFVDFSKKYDEIRNLRIEIEKMRDIVFKAVKSLDQFNMDRSNLATKDDLAKLSSAVDSIRSQSEGRMYDDTSVRQWIAYLDKRVSETESGVKDAIATSQTINTASVNSAPDRSKDIDNLILWITYLGDRLTTIEKAMGMKRRQ